MLLTFIAQHNIRVLNIAGPRASEEPHVGLFVEEVLDEAWLEQRKMESRG
jgi:hypothetical protein